MSNSQTLVLIPRPASIRFTGANAVAVDGLEISADAAAAGAAGLLKGYVQALEGWQSGAGAKFVVRLDPAASVEGNDESYRLRIGATSELVAPSVNGLLQGVQTVRQLLQREGGRWVLPAVEIEDRPKYGWRGVMLDVGRHFFSVAEVKRMIDLAAMYHVNRFHMHLTDDQGWRVEIKKYPKLTEVGAWREESPAMGNANVGDGQAYGGFYTQEQIRDFVKYAAERGVVVVPEFEMPGHSTAAIAAYPHLGNTDIPGWQTPKVSPRWSVHHNTFAPREETFKFISDVIDEMIPLFPGPWFHIGGDEAPKDQWLASPFAQRVMRENNLADGEALQSWFLQRVEKMLTQRGKRLVGWDEIQEGGLPTTATVMVWRDWKWARHAVERGNPIVMSVTSHTYFDYKQGPSPEGVEYQTIGGGEWQPALPVEKTMQFDPLSADLPAGREKRLLGTQGQVWTEYIWSMDKAEYMLFPRMCALAEIAWGGAIKDQGEFAARLVRHEKVMDRYAVNYRKGDGSPARADSSMGRTPRPKR